MKRDDRYLYLIAIIVFLVTSAIIGAGKTIKLENTVNELKNENDRLQTEVKLLRARDDINIKHIERLHLLGGEELTKKIYAEDAKEDK